MATDASMVCFNIINLHRDRARRAARVSNDWRSNFSASARAIRRTIASPTARRHHRAQMGRAAALAVVAALTLMECSVPALPPALPDAGPSSTVAAIPTHCAGRPGTPGDFRYRIHSAGGLREYL